MKRLPHRTAFSAVMICLSAIVLMLTPPKPSAAQDGLDDARKMVNGAVEAIVESGWPGALVAVPPETWIRLEEDLYVFIMNTRGDIVFHPNRGAIGVNVSGATDVDGYAYMQDLMGQLASDGATGVVEYYWPRPSDGEMRLKRTYARRIGNLLVACGVYVEDI
ncbi:cache domain-containing protein [Hwanghaeella sp.]|uniref:cache domain-containing protein n=1 Tax=Hwanghaeella sp. TaxID=2605943 RepID=UPI003CCBE8B8